MAANDWSTQVENMEALGASFAQIQRKALRQAANVIKPRLEAATPVRGVVAGGQGPLREGALRSAVRGHVVKEDEDSGPSAVVDFGKLSYIAHMVDVGHRAPHARVLERSGHPITGKPTPAHPFVRAVEDSSASVAQDTFETAMDAGLDKALAGS